MKTCPNCGVLYDTKDGKCPLCQKESVIIDLNRKMAFTKAFYWRIYSIFSLAAFLIILVIDLVYNPGLTWSKIPLISICYAWLSLHLILIARLKSFPPVFIETMASFIMLVLLDRFTSGKAWSIYLALPILISLCILLSVSLLVRRFSNFSILQTTAFNVFLAGFFLIILEVLLKNYKMEALSLSWSLIAFAGLLPLCIFFYYFDKKIKKRGEELKKYFHF
jgi:hypothetical protein